MNEHVRTWNASQRVKGTYLLESEERGTREDTERKRASEVALTFWRARREEKVRSQRKRESEGHPPTGEHIGRQVRTQKESERAKGGYSRPGERRGRDM